MNLDKKCCRIIKCGNIFSLIKLLLFKHNFPIGHGGIVDALHQTGG